MIRNVTLVRLVSTYILVMYHSRIILFALGIGDAEFESMRAGTDLFIVCSAFLTTHVNSHKPISAWAFLRKRLVRIVPLYWTVTLAVFALVLVFPRLLSSTKSDVGDLLMSLFFIPYLKESHLIQPIVFVAWTLNLIMLFSVIYTLSLGLAGMKRAWLAAMGIVGALVAGGLLFRPSSIPLKFYTDLLMVEFVFGLAISRFSGVLLSAAPSGRSRTMDIAACCGLAVLAFAAIIGRPYLWPDIHRAFAYGIPCSALLAVAIRLDAHGFSVRAPFLQKMSGYSYSIYLSHFFSTAFFGLILEKLKSGTPFWAAAFLLLTLMTATITGVILNHVVERPLVAVFERSNLSIHDCREGTILRKVFVMGERFRCYALTKRVGGP